MDLSRRGFIATTVASVALAHVSWPWCDECVAVYGKILNAVVRRGFEIPEMFIDTTPGTPKFYRRGLQRYLFGGDNTKRNIPTPDGRNGNPGK